MKPGPALLSQWNTTLQIMHPFAFDALDGTAYLTNYVIVAVMAIAIVGFNKKVFFETPRKPKSSSVE
jgi:hypothetical protein